MTDATDFTSVPQVRSAAPARMALPAPVVCGAPVLISDCATPLTGETVLSLLWKRLDAGRDADRP